MSFTQTLHHVVWATKYRRPVLCKPHRVLLYKYISGIITNKKCHVYAINGVENHIHIGLAVHPKVALADLVQDMKVASNKFIREKNLFPDFSGWQKGYGAFALSYSELDSLVLYIEDQEKHHANKSFESELIETLVEHDVGFEMQYLFEDP